MIKQFEIIRSNRKTISLEITRDLRVVVRAPMRMKQSDIDGFIEKKTAWIEKHLEIMKSRTAGERQAEAFSKEEIMALCKEALTEIPPRAEAFAQMLGVSYGRITVRNQVSRWGSCSAKGNLSFNCLLMLCPNDVVDYVIIHELCHRIQMNHSKEFWVLVEKYCPNYKNCRSWLKENGNGLIWRLRARDSVGSIIDETE